MKLTLVGLGLVGTSLGLALKSANSELEIVGHDPDPERSKRARSLGAIDKSHWNLIAACEGTDLVVLDLSLVEVEKTLGAIGDTLEDRTIVLDTAAIKRPVLEMADRLLPERVQFIGGHLVSAHLASSSEPSSSLLSGAVFYLVPGQGTDARALDAASNLANAVGATPCYIDAAEHDGVMASTSHLALASALAVMSALGGEEGIRERARAVGSEIAAQSELMDALEAASVDLLLANADNLGRWLDALATELDVMRREIAEGDHEALSGRLDAAQALCRQWILGDAPNEEPALQVESPWRRMLFGGLGRSGRETDRER